MAIKNKDGSIYSYSKPNPTVAEQDFWGKDEPVIVHNKFGTRKVLETKREPAQVHVQKEVKVPDFREFEKQKEEQIKIVEAIKESAPKHVSESVVEVWCLPCVKTNEKSVEYGEKFIFRARLLTVEDLYVQLVAEASVEIPLNSVIYPQTQSKRWWQVNKIKPVKDFILITGLISDYQPSFSD